MKHTDFYGAIRAIEEQARHELAEAVKAVGGTFIPYYGEDGLDGIIIVGEFKHCPGSEDILVTKVEVNDTGKPVIYGKPNESCEMDEEPVYFMEPGYIHFIIEAIPGTEAVRSVADAERSKETAEKVRDILTRIENEEP